MAVTGLTIITDALVECGVHDPVETPSAEDTTFALRKLNRLINNWNAEREAVYASTFLTFTLTPSLSPHTIGPTGATWTVTQRPVSLEAAHLVLAGSSPVAQIPIRVRDAAWWSTVSVQALTSTIPTDVYYDPAWVNGNLYFWPVPTAAHSVQLWVRAVLAEYALATTFSLPPGYQDAITLTLAEEIGPAFHAPPSLVTIQSAKAARARIFSKNTTAPPLTTRDAGMPGGGSGRAGYFNYRSGQHFT